MNSETVSLRDAYIQAGFSKKSYPAWVRRYFSKEIAEFPGIDSLKCGNFMIPLKRAYSIIANISHLSKNKEKVQKWIAETSKKLNVPNELPLFSILANPLFRQLFCFTMDYGKYINNISGMSYTARNAEMSDLIARQKRLFENILEELNISLCLPEKLSRSEFSGYYAKYIGIPRNMTIMDVLYKNGFVDSHHNGKFVSEDFIDCRVLYILIIRYLWK